MSLEYNFTTTYIYNYGDFYGMSQFYNKIKDHITSLIRNEKKNNNRICINVMLVRLVNEIITRGYSPFTYLSEELVTEKLKDIKLEDIINKGLEWINKYKLCRCNIYNMCFNSLGIDYNIDIVKNIIKQNIIEYGILPRCRYLLLSYQYYLQEKKLGNLQEISEYEILLNEIEMDPEEFHSKYKHKIPTQNLSKLEYKKMSEELSKEKEPSCGICLSDIEQNQKYYELPCGHLFHENGEECLECATIIFWLRDNKLCPICKQEVIL
jgi:hypothetical protein